MFRYFSKNKGLLLLITVVLASFLIMTSQVRQPRGAGLAERGVSALAYPFARAVNIITGSVKDAWNGYFNLVGAGRENAALRKQNGALSLENTRLRNLLASDVRVGELMALREGLPYRMVPAHLIGRDASTWFKSAWIDEGESAGVRKNMPAAVYTGIVGKVMRTDGHTSRVMLITDPGSAVSCVTERTREPGILVGEGNELCRFQYVGKQADVAAGDLVITSGLDGVYPAGMPVGEIVKAVKPQQGYFQDIMVRPTADIKGIEEMMVLMYTPPARPAPEPAPAKKEAARP
ncbi:MAG: rod shape-determining protein MreC [Nitrospirota bacterium]